MKSVSQPFKEDIDQASERFLSRFPETPVFSSEYINRDVGAEVYFKMESLMPQVGVFKIRGALQSILSLSDKERRKGVLAQSSGNHGQSVAYVARELGIPSYVVVPEDAPEVKKCAMRYFGSELLISGASPEERSAMTIEMIERLGLPLIHPFQNSGVIAGQATVTREFIHQIPGLEDLIVQIGGGGLIAGASLSKEFYQPDLRIFGAESDQSDDCRRRFYELPEREKGIQTVADGMRVPVGDVNFSILKDRVEEIYSVSDAEIISAMFYLWQHLRVILEPSAVVGFAALRKNISSFVGKKVGVILSGGNVDMQRAVQLFRNLPAM